MIVEMARVRVLGPSSALDATVRAVQDLGVLHVVDAAVPGAASTPAGDDRVARRRARHLRAALADVDTALDDLAALGAPVDEHGPVAVVGEGQAARIAARTRRAAQALLRRSQLLADEHSALRAFEPLFAELDQLFGEGRDGHRFSAYLLLLRAGGTSQLDQLRAALDHALAGGHDLRVRTLPSGQTALLLIVPAARADEIEHLLADAHVERAPLPPGLAGQPLAEALPRLRPRLAEVERAQAELAATAEALTRDRAPWLRGARRCFNDALRVAEAGGHAVRTGHAFVLEGWLPVRDRPALVAALDRALAGQVAVEEVGREAAHSDDAPVVLSNPAVFAPFERLTSMLPLPRYGTVDPTPFVAVFFPMFFGVVVGDVGYGAVMAIAAALLYWRSRPGGLARDLAKIAAAVAVYAIAFGVVFGEALGDLGHRLVGMEPLWIDRREAVEPFLGLALSLGLVHLLLGLVVAAINRWRRHRREAVGRGLIAVMLGLIAVALLAVFELLPGRFFTPAIVALLVAFPIVIAIEGFTALLDLVSIVGHVLSYARVMALGIASVMLAAVANGMVGAFGSVAVGVVFALLFHLVNFAITLFSPTIHVLRLHYVEFFGTFFVPGGDTYRPLTHWQPDAAPAT